MQDNKGLNELSKEELEAAIAERRKEISDLKDQIVIYETTCNVWEDVLYDVVNGNPYETTRRGRIRFSVHAKDVFLVCKNIYPLEILPHHKNKMQMWANDRDQTEE